MSGQLTVNLLGGLGNQLFEIFGTLKYAKKYNMKAIFPNIYKLDSKRHSYYDLFPDLEIGKAPLDIYVAKECHLESLNPSKNYRFEDHFQAYKHVEGINYFDYFKLDKYDDVYMQEKMKALRRLSRPLVSVHVRRGDYLEVPHWHNVLGVEYYKNALEFFKDVENPLFVVFSEDRKWCQENLKFLGDFIIVNEKDYIELFMMSKCDANIIANSSFSWWGGLLNNNQDKIVVYPAKWYETKMVDTSELCPSSWKSCRTTNE
jgi:hypothetical protein